MSRCFEKSYNSPKKENPIMNAVHIVNKFY